MAVFIAAIFFATKKSHTTYLRVIAWLIEKPPNEFRYTAKSNLPCTMEKYDKLRIF